MTPAQLDLARALVAIPGMPDIYDPVWSAGGRGGPERILSGPLAGAAIAWTDAADGGLDAVLDLTDAATEGALLRMLWAVDPGAVIRRDPHRSGGPAFTVALNDGRADGATLGEAVARALVAVGRCS